jgi:hypothetical protein
MQCHPAGFRQVRYHCDGIPQLYNCLASHSLPLFRSRQSCQLLRKNERSEGRGHHVA